jgi:hypothetical protein
VLSRHAESITYRAYRHSALARFDEANRVRNTSVGKTDLLESPRESTVQSPQNLPGRRRPLASIKNPVQGLRIHSHDVIEKHLSVSKLGHGNTEKRPGTPGTKPDRQDPFWTEPLDHESFGHRTDDERASPRSEVEKDVDAPVGEDTFPNGSGSTTPRRPVARDVRTKRGRRGELSIRH